MVKTKEELRIYKRNWARKKYGVTEEGMKKSATYKGRRSELLALKILEGAIDMNDKVMNRPYDVEFNGERIDVKSCNLYKRKFKQGKPVEKSCGWWVFNKNKGYADKYFCICMERNIPVKYYLIPKEYFNNGITIGQKSLKFDKYLFNNIL